MTPSPPIHSSCSFLYRMHCNQPQYVDNEPKTYLECKQSLFVLLLNLRVQMFILMLLRDMQCFFLKSRPFHFFQSGLVDGRKLILSGCFDQDKQLRKNLTACHSPKTEIIRDSFIGEYYMEDYLYEGFWLWKEKTCCRKRYSHS